VRHSRRFAELRGCTPLAQGTRTMKTTALPLVVLALSGCFQVPQPSNNPDSGATCFPAQSPAGSGTTQGVRSFSVGSSYQHLTQTIPPDAGTIAGATLYVRLLEQALPCAATTDGGDDGSYGLWLSVVASGADRVGPGTYATSPDAGPSLWGFAATDAGLLAIQSGSIPLATVADCSASGSFHVPLRAGDAGRAGCAGQPRVRPCSAAEHRVREVDGEPHGRRPAAPHVPLRRSGEPADTGAAL